MSLSTISQLAINRLVNKGITKTETNGQDSLFLKQNNLQLNTTGTKNNIENTAGVLFSYIPTESIALYVAVLGALSSNDLVMKAHWVAFFFFLVFTPLVVWIIYAAKVKKLLGYVPFNYQALPLWEMTASTLAFVAWAFALPGSVFQSFTWYNQSIAGVTILVTSTILGLVSPFFEKS